MIAVMGFFSVLCTTQGARDICVAPSMAGILSWTHLWANTAGHGRSARMASRHLWPALATACGCPGNTGVTARCLRTLHAPGTSHPSPADSFDGFCGYAAIPRPQGDALACLAAGHARRLVARPPRPRTSLSLAFQSIWGVFLYTHRRLPKNKKLEATVLPASAWHPWTHAAA